MRFNYLNHFICLSIVPILFGLFSVASAQDKDLEKMVQEARKIREQSQPLDIRIDGDALLAARERVKDIKLKAADPKLLGDLFGYDIEEEIDRIDESSDGEVLYVFVSFSMSDKLLRSYIQDVAKTGGVVVISGLYNGSFTQTVKKIEEYAYVEEGVLAGGVMIDPKAFETFGITHVPTILLAETQLSPCLSPTCDRDVPRHDKLQGSVSLEYALNLFAREGDLSDAASDKHALVSRDIYSTYRD